MKIDWVHLEIHYHVLMDILMDLHWEPLYKYVPLITKSPKKPYGMVSLRKIICKYEVPMSQVSSIGPQVNFF